MTNTLIYGIIITERKRKDSTTQSAKVHNNDDKRAGNNKIWRAWDKELLTRNEGQLDKSRLRGRWQDVQRDADAQGDLQAVSLCATRTQAQH